MALANAASVFANPDGRVLIVLAEIASILAFRHEAEKFALAKANVFVANANVLKRMVDVIPASTVRNAQLAQVNA